MICAKPFRQDGFEFGCGQCMPCRINRSRLWTARLLLESTQHEASSFITLTYNDDHLPKGGVLCPKDLTDFWKRLRKIWPRQLRYFAVGEYGEMGGRPHYHAALFGLNSKEVIEKAWSLHGSRIGHVDCSGLGPESCAYITGYILKGATKEGDARLSGKVPEFSRMSRKPGIGSGAVVDLQRFYTTQVGSRVLAEQGDVKQSFRSGGKVYPLGRYLTNRVRLACGFEGVPKESLEAKRLDNYADMKLPEVVLRKENARVNSLRKAEFRNSVQRSKRRL